MPLSRLHKQLIITAALASVTAAAAPAAFAALRPHEPDPVAENLIADLSERKLYIKEGDSVVETFPVAIGKGSKPTPQGNYRIRKIVWNPAWIPPDEPWAKNKKPQPPGAKFFDCLVANIEKLMETGETPYPVERTLLTSGVLAAAMESHYRRGARVETPELDVAYAAPADSGFTRGSIAAPA